MKKTKAIALTPEETRLMEQLRQHPEIKERLRSILEIAGSEEGPMKTADQVERNCWSKRCVDRATSR